MSQIEDYEWMLHYLRILDPINAKIIGVLGEYPRNLSSLAEKTGLPPSTVAFRVKKLVKKGYLKVRIKINSPKLGLCKALLFADINHGFTETLQKTIENIGYWSYVARCYGKYNGFYAVFSFPFSYKTQLEDYFERAKELGATPNYTLLWTTNIYEVTPNFAWFDFKRKSWNFAWQKWIDEVATSPDRLPERLEDPKSYEVQVDSTDLLILKELEKDGFEDFTQLSKVVKMTPQAVRHRFLQHVIARNLTTGYGISIFPYPVQVSDMCAFVFNFSGQQALAKFVNTLEDKPFVLSYAKAIGKDSLLVHFYVPKTEFSNFMLSLDRLNREEIMQDFYYIYIDIPSYKRQTVSFECFHDGRWLYNHVEQLKQLTEMMPLKLKSRSPSS